MDATFTAVARLWKQKCSQREIANRLSISEPKVRKILITIGAIKTDESQLFATGLSIEEIADKLGKSPKAVLGRLPYTKGSTAQSIRQSMPCASEKAAKSKH